MFHKMSLFLCVLVLMLTNGCARVTAHEDYADFEDLLALAEGLHFSWDSSKQSPNAFLCRECPAITTASTIPLVLAGRKSWKKTAPIDEVCPAAIWWRPQQQQQQH